MTETTKVTLTEAQALERLVNVHREINTLSEDLKELLSEIKEADLDHSTLNKVAALIAKEKYQDFREKTEKVLDLLETVGK